MFSDLYNRSLFCDSQTLNKEQGLRWIKDNRFPAFLQSDLYIEYRLAKILSQVRISKVHVHIVCYNNRHHLCEMSLRQYLHISISPCYEINCISRRKLNNKPRPSLSFATVLIYVMESGGYVNCRSQ